MVQDDRELTLAFKAGLDTPTRLGSLADLAIEGLVFYEDEIDRTRPIRLIYMSEIGPVSAAYLPGGAVP